MRERLITAAAMVLAAGLTGCSGDATPAEPVTPHPTITTTPSPTSPVEPELPDAATEPTAEGAKAFVRHYWAMANYAQQTGDTDGIRALASVTCEPCDRAANAVDDIYGRHGVIVGGEYAVTGNMRAIRTDLEPPRFALSFLLLNREQAVDFPGTNEDGEFGAGRNRARMNIDFLRGAWRVAYWGRA